MDALNFIGYFHTTENPTDAIIGSLRQEEQRYSSQLQGCHIDTSLQYEYIQHTYKYLYKFIKFPEFTIDYYYTIMHTTYDNTLHEIVLVTCSFKCDAFIYFRKEFTDSLGYL